jgi:hypothetical protein
MTLVEFEDFYREIDTLEAQEMLRGFQVSTYPNLKDESRSKLYKSVRKIAFPNEKQKIVSFDDIDKVLG